MTTLKLQGKPSAAASQALQPHVQAMYDRVGKPWVAIIELTQAERVEPAPSSDKDRAVVMRIIGAEVASGDFEGQVREVQRALFIMRTATGTLTEEHDVALSRQTIADAGGILQLTAIAKISAGVSQWCDYLARVGASSKLTEQELRHEIDSVRSGLLALLGRQWTIDEEEDPEG